jgi:hypothetical protein
MKNISSLRSQTKWPYPYDESIVEFSEMFCTQRIKINGFHYRSSIDMKKIVFDKNIVE